MLVLALALLGVAWIPVQRRTSQVLILVSIDGFRPDYLDLGVTPNLNGLAARGVRAQWMEPSFPSLTFPNHYTLVTGLLPAHHGITSNTMVDPSDGARFRINDPAAVTASRWWGGEPLWVTAIKQGRKSASYFWPGSEARIEGIRPTYYETYSDTVSGPIRVEGVLHWLRNRAADRPSFITLYFSDVDHAGHDFGPGTPEMQAAAAHVDAMIGLLLNGLRRLNVLNRANVVVVSDHGMAKTSTERVVLLDDYLSPASLDILSVGAFIALRPRDGDAGRVVRALAAAPHVQVFLRDSTPARWRYRGNPRIADVVGVADPGWTVTLRSIARDTNRTRGGNHGYDPADSTMRATFLAAGPAFRRGLVVAPFGNLHVYDLLCAALGLTPARNDGSLDSVAVMLR